MNWNNNKLRTLFPETQRTKTLVVYLLVGLLMIWVGVNYGSPKINASPIISDPVARIYTKMSIDSIKNSYDILIRSECYEQLITKQKEVLELSKKIYDNSSAELAQEYHWLGYFNSKCENYSEALSCVQMSANIYNLLGSEYLGEYFDVLEKIALYNYLQDNMEAALRAYSHILDEFYNKNAIIVDPYTNALRMSLAISQQFQLPILLDKPLEFLFSDFIEDEDKFNLISDVVIYYIDKNNPTKAIEVYKLAETITGRHPEFLTHEKWGDILLNIVNAYLAIGDYDGAIAKLRNAEVVYAGIANPINTYYVHYSMGNIRHQQHLMQQAFDSYNKAIMVIDKLADMDIAKANLFALQARCMLALNDRDEADLLIEKAIALIDNQRQYASHEIVEIYDVYSLIAFQKGLYDDVIKRLKDVKESYVLSDYFAQQIDLRIGKAYAEIGDYNNAVLIADSISRKLPEDNKLGNTTKAEFEVYLVRVTSLATIYSLSDRLSDAIHLLKHAYEICELHRFNTSEGYGALLNNLGLYNCYLGNYDDARKFSLLSLGFNQSRLNVDYFHLFETLSNLFLISLQTKDEENLHYYARMSFDAMQNIESVNFAEVETYMRNLLHYFVVIDDLEQADAISSYIQSQSAKLYGKDSPRYYQAISSTIYLFEAKHDWDSLITLASAVLNNYENDLYLRKAPIYYSLLNASMQKGDDIKSSEILRETYQHEVEKVQMFASDFDSVERLYLLRDIQNYIISRGSSYVSENNITKSIRNSIIETIYNGILLFKGLNLQIDQNVNDGIKSLHICNMQDVQSRLSSNECAIEFIHFPLNNDSTMYMAYVLRKDMEAPVLVKLLEEKELTNLSDTELYTRTNASKLIWQKLQPELEGVENVYFAPDGILHQIAIEYLPDFENYENYISDRFNLYRLSSTRQLAISKPVNHSDNAVIYGGIKYDTDSETMINVTRKFAVTRGFKPSYNIVDSLSTRSRKGYLEHTLTEAKSINKMFKDMGQTPILIIGDEATEESFKNLSGKENRFIHIATHGFYWEADEADYEASVNERLLFMSQFGDIARRNIEDKALTRTGLFMAGVNNTLTGKEMPEDIDDGILTAQEIANLDLSGLDLAVLSACQTGMGDISSDGVFGLQRGFKKAGANSILMSLWNVDDEATQILMTNFYKNYLGGMSKQGALRAVQKTVREIPRFSAPEYWAAFILLDAFN